MGLFKRAAVRGIAHQLVADGFVKFPTKEAMEEAADAVADSVPEGAPAEGGMPEMAPEAGHDPNQLALIANKLIEIGEQLMAECGAGQGGMPPEAAAQGAEALHKESSSKAIEDIAGLQAQSLMQKAAAEVERAKVANPQGALIHGGDKKNEPAAAAKTDSVAAMDEKNRPQGTYQVSRGDTALPSMQGHVGALEGAPKPPHNTPGGSNSVAEDAHKKSAAEWARKVASKLIGLPGDHKNTAAAAAKTDTVAELDKKQRPAGYAVVGQGNANFKEPQAARVGVETPHPAAPAAKAPGGPNSVIDASKAAQLTEKEAAFVALFDECANDVGSYLPASLPQEMKVAALRHMIGMDHDERQEYLNGLHAEKTADLAAMLAAKDKDGHEEKCEKCDKGEKCEKHNKEAKKEGALLAHIRDIAARATAAPAPAAK